MAKIAPTHVHHHSPVSTDRVATRNSPRKGDDHTPPPPTLRRGHPGHSPSPTTPPKLKKTPEKASPTQGRRSPGVRQGGKITSYFSPAQPPAVENGDSDVILEDHEDEGDFGDDDVITFASPEGLEEEDDVGEEEEEDSGSGKENEDWRFASRLSPRVLDLATSPPSSVSTTATSSSQEQQPMPSPRSELKGAVSPSPSNNSSSSPLQPRRVTRSRAAQKAASIADTLGGTTRGGGDHKGPGTTAARAADHHHPSTSRMVNGHSSPHRPGPHSYPSLPSPGGRGRNTPPHSPPTPHKIKLLDQRNGSTEDRDEKAISTTDDGHDEGDDDVTTTKTPPPPNGLQKARRDLTRFLLAKPAAESEPPTSNGPKNRLPSSPSENGDLLENGDILSGNNKSSKTKGSDKEISEAVVHQATLPGDQKGNQKTTASVTRKVTDFFQIRRSSRKPKTEIEAEQQSEIDAWLVKGQKCNDSALGIGIANYEGKGRGIEARKQFKKGDFVVEYAGELMESPAAAKEREDFYASDAATGCYMYYFKHGDKQYCIDATAESGRLGRLVNHSRLAPNCQTKVVMVRDVPRLILIAKTDIEPGTELLYDYGDRSKESLKAHPWLAL